MMADEFPEIGVVSPTTLGDSPVLLYLDVVDVDHVHARAVASGATSVMAPEDQPHGNRTATIVDPFGHRWMLSQHLEDLYPEAYAAREEASGDWTVTPSTAPVELGYVTMPTADLERSRRFFGELFGWQVAPATPERATATSPTPASPWA